MAWFRQASRNHLLDETKDQNGNSDSAQSTSDPDHCPPEPGSTVKWEAEVAENKVVFSSERKVPCEQMILSGMGFSIYEVVRVVC